MRADAPATILNIGSVAGSFAYPGGNCYGGTKAFVERFSKNLRADLVGRHVRVTNVEPGLTETEFSIVKFKDDKIVSIFSISDVLTMLKDIGVVEVPQPVDPYK